MTVKELPNMRQLNIRKLLRRIIIYACSFLHLSKYLLMATEYLLMTSLRHDLVCVLGFYYIYHQDF